MELSFNESNKTIRISSVTMCEWSCIVTEGNFTLNKYYGKLPLNNSNYIDINLMTYSTDEIFGNITCVFKSDNCVTKKSLTLNQIPLHIFSVTNTDIFLFGENTKSYVYVYYGIAQQNYDNVLKPLQLTIGNQTLRYNGTYSSIEITENGQKLYDIIIQPYNQTLGLFEICFKSTCDLPFSDVVILEGVNDKNETQILHVNIKQGIVEHTPSLLNISPKFIFLSSDNPRQKINVTSLNNGIVGEYYISETAPIQVQNNEEKNDVESYLNGDYSIEPYINKNLDVLNLVKEKNATHFILDMSDCENGDDNVDDGGNIPYELYVVNAKDNSMYHKLEFFYDYIFDADNYIQIESVTNAKAYIYKKNSGSDNGTIKSISADTDNKISLVSDEFDMQISLTLLFIKKDTYNEQNFLKEEYIDYVIAEYNENENIIFTIKSKPDWWKILTLSDYVKEVKNGNDLSIALEKIIPNNGEIEYVTLENKLGKKCTVYLKTEGNIFENEIYSFGFSKNSGSTKPLSSLNIETKPKLFSNSTYLISEAEQETIINVDIVKTIENNNSTSITVPTIFYTYDGNDVITTISSHTFNILLDTNIGKKYINYGSISKKNFDGKVEEHTLKDNNMYYIENNSVTLPIPRTTKYIPWSIVNYGTGIKYEMYSKNLEINNSYYFPNDSRSVKIKICDFLPINLEDNVLYITPTFKTDTFEDVSTIIFQQYGTLKEVYLYINRKTNNNLSAFVNKIGSSPSLNRMKYLTSTSLNDVISATTYVPIIINDNETKNAYYASYNKTNSFSVVENYDIEFFILKDGEIKYEKNDYLIDSVSGNELNKLYYYNGKFETQDIDNIIRIILNNKIVIDNWEINDGFLYIKNNDQISTKTFPQIGIKTLFTDSKYYIYLEDNDNDTNHYLLVLEQSYSVYFDEKINVKTDDKNNPYFEKECLYNVINKSIIIDGETYTFDEMDSFIYPYDGIRYYCYEENGKLYVDLKSKDFDIKYQNVGYVGKYYIDVFGKKLYLNNFECTYDDVVYSPHLKINLKGLTLEVLENVDGDTEEEKEEYIILNNKKYVCNKVINDNLKFEYVDLKLPNKTLWAKTNVGAESEEDYGLYFSWGNVEGVTEELIQQANNDTNNEHYYFGKHNNIIGDLVSYITVENDIIQTNKYNSIDERNNLLIVDDGCNYSFQGNWHIPSIEQIQELINNTIHELTTINGINGFKFTSKVDNTKYIFIPCGIVNESSQVISNSVGIWSNTVFSGDNYTNAYMLSGNTTNNNNETNLSTNVYKRYNAMPIRGIGGVKTIALNTNYKLEIKDNKITFNEDYYLDIINEPSHEYVIINQEKHKLNDGVLVYENNKYIPIKVNEFELNNGNRYILINNKGYKVYSSPASYYCIINNTKYYFNATSLSSNTINFISSSKEIKNNEYYTINEIVNEEFSYYLDFNNLLDNKLITCSYNNKQLSIGYADIEDNYYSIEKEYNIDEDTYDVIGNEYVSIPIVTILKQFHDEKFDIQFHNEKFDIQFHDETEIINHNLYVNDKLINTTIHTKYQSGDTLTYNQINGLILTINDYSKITFKTPTLFQVKNDCNIILHLKNEDVELILLENETLIVDGNLTLTFSDITKIKLIHDENIPLYVFDDVAVINEDTYASVLSNDQKAIYYNNNFYFVFNEKVNILDTEYDVYEKSIFYKRLTNNGVISKTYQVNKYNDEDFNTVNDYGYIDNNSPKTLEKTNYKNIVYKIHLPIYNVYTKWGIGEFELNNIKIYNLDTEGVQYTRCTFTYLNKSVVIENGYFHFKINAYEIFKNDIFSQYILSINDDVKEFTDNDMVYSFWDYYANTYLKKIKCIETEQQQLSIKKNIILNNIKCDVEANKYIKIDGKLYPIIKVNNLKLKNETFNLVANTTPSDKYKTIELKYIILNNNEFSSSTLTHIIKKTVTFNQSDLSYTQQFFIYPEYKIIRDNKVDDTLTGKTLSNIVNSLSNEDYKSVGDEIITFKELSTYDNENEFYVVYNNNVYPIVNSIAYVTKNMNIINGIDGKIHTLYDADSYLTNNMYALTTYEKEGNVRMLKIKNAIEMPHEETMIIKVKVDDGYLYGKYLLDFKNNEE